MQFYSLLCNGDEKPLLGSSFVIRRCSTIYINFISEGHGTQSQRKTEHVIPGMWYTVSATNAAALCQRWLRDTLCQSEKATALAENRNAFAVMDELAQQSRAGANGVMFHPYLQGERSPYWDAKLRGSFTGLSISSSKGDFIRTLLEGVAYSLRDCYTAIEEMDLAVKKIYLIGGGSRSELWSNIVCNVFNKPVEIPTPGDASFGTALLAGTGAKVFADSTEAVKKCLHLDRKLEPDAELAEFYAQEFKTYKAIHDALQPVYAQR